MLRASPGSLALILAALEFLAPSLALGQITWTIVTVDSGGVGNNCSLALDNAGEPRVSYRVNDSNQVRYARSCVFDVAGRRVRSLLSGAVPAGLQTVAWDGRDARGRAVAAGTYFLRLRAGAEFEASDRLTVVR